MNEPQARAQVATMAARMAAAVVPATLTAADLEAITSVAADALSPAEVVTMRQSLYDANNALQQALINWQRIARA